MFKVRLPQCKARSAGEPLQSSFQIQLSSLFISNVIESPGNAFLILSIRAVGTNSLVGCDETIAKEYELYS